MRGSQADPASEGEHLAGFVRDLRAAHLRAPDPAVETDDIAAMVAASAVAHSEQEGALHRRRSPIRTWRRRTLGNRFSTATARLLVTATAAFLGLAGLALAGVTLPDPARGVAHSLGLPNQDGKSDDSPASRVLGEEPPPSHPGCEFGQKVAERASDGKVAADDPCSKGNDERSEQKRSKRHSDDRDSDSRSDQGDKNSNFGQETARRAHDQRDARVQQRREFGQETAQRAHDRNESQGQSNNHPPAHTPAGHNGGGGGAGNSGQGASGPPAGVPNGPPGGGPPGRP